MVYKGENLESLDFGVNVQTQSKDIKHVNTYVKKFYFRDSLHISTVDKYGDPVGRCQTQELPSKMIFMKLS